MLKPSREQVKKIFRKKKHLKIPKEYEEIDFSNLFYYSWYDPNDRNIYMLFEHNDAVDGIAWNTEMFSTGDIRLGRCEICKQIVELRDMALVTSKTRFRRKGTVYVARGNYICSHYEKCNKMMTNREGLDILISLIFKDN